MKDAFGSIALYILSMFMFCSFDRRIPCPDDHHRQVGAFVLACDGACDVFLSNEGRSQRTDGLTTEACA